MKWLSKHLVRSRDDGLRLDPIADVPATNPVLAHLNSQINWYDENSKRTMTAHFRLRTAQLVLAAAIPVTQLLLEGLPARATAGAMAAVIAAVQGFDSLHHYGDHYVSWRATTQQLWRERFLFAAAAGPYKAAAPHGSVALELLAERVDNIESQENHQWHDQQLRNGPGGRPQTVQ